MELLKHIVIHNFKETGEEIIKNQQEEDNIEKEKPTVLSEFMLVEFLV